ncbi:MAG: hypothetical protein JWO07_545 [Candidatus Saccharibacteria bacterium]|nr:hypothetical protein [Candidatus Saccharibacteria bacterium]
MQPNDQQGYYQPGQPQPGQGAVPPVPPVNSTITPGIAPVVDPNALQAALNEPGPQVQMPEPGLAPEQEPESESELPPVDDQELTDEQYEEQDYELSDEPVTWVAHEFIHREKGAGWFMAFGVVVLALIAVSIFLMGSWSFAVLLAVIFVVVIVFSRRPPRELTYSLTDEGLAIDGKIHPFTTFKSFGVIQDGEEFSVMLIPTQRFQPGITVYFPEESGEAIVDMLGSRLPMKDLKLDAVDRVVRMLRL